MRNSTKAGLALSAAGSAAMMLLSQSAHANTLVATIIGAYDAQCGAACPGVQPAGISHFATNGGTTYDTPSLFILNPTGQAFTGITLKLTGYQDAAGNVGASGDTYNGAAGSPVTQTLTLPSIAAHTTYQLTWGGAIGGGSIGSPTAGGINLFAYDYDDQMGGPAGPFASDPAGHTCTINIFLCAFVGNFDVDFEAMWNGKAISSNFSPDNTQGGGNVQGSFVPWLGLDQNGLSDVPGYDVHTNTFPGTLANIVTGTHQCGGTCQVPEPASLGLLGVGLAALGLGRRRKSA